MATRLETPSEGIFIRKGFAISSPTGEIVTFGKNNEFRIPVHRQVPGSEFCAEACLAMLGYPACELVTDNVGVAPLDVEMFAGAQDMDWTKEGFIYDVPYMIEGIRHATNNPHWYIRVGNNVIDPLNGVVEDAEAYERREIGEIVAVMRVPFLTSS